MVSALLLTPACVENDPCFFPDDYAACGVVDRLAGCPGYGPLLLGPIPNVAPAYDGEPDGIGGDHLEEYLTPQIGWELVQDKAEGGRTRYMRPPHDNIPVKYGFDLPCDELGPEVDNQHRLYVWIRARVTAPGQGAKLTQGWGAGTTRTVVFDGPPEAPYQWTRYNDTLLSEVEGESKGHFALISHDDPVGYVQIDGLCQSSLCTGSVEGIERILITADADYTPAQ